LAWSSWSVTNRTSVSRRDPGIAGPASVITCDISSPARPAADDFRIDVTEARGPDSKPLAGKPALVVAGVTSR
jgi:hypothetical protein